MHQIAVPMWNTHYNLHHQLSIKLQSNATWPITTKHLSITLSKLVTLQKLKNSLPAWYKLKTVWIHLHEKYKKMLVSFFSPISNILILAFVPCYIHFFCSFLTITPTALQRLFFLPDILLKKKAQKANLFPVGEGICELLSSLLSK